MRCFRPWRSRGFRLAAASAEGMLYVLGGALASAWLVWKAGLPPMSVLRFVSGLLWGVGAFLAGRRSGLQGRRFGALEGAVCGAVLLVLRLCGTLLLSETWTHLRLYAVLLPLMGASGGILGVNTKRKTPPS